MKYTKLSEEQLKSTIAQDFFKVYKYTQLGNIDFVVAKHNAKGASIDLFEDDIGNLKSILWAEAKQGSNHDILESFVQLLLTIGKERTFEKFLPPKYIGAFDAAKFAFIEYHSIQEIFYQNDFNWNVTPSNHDTKEFKQLLAMCKQQLDENKILFHYASDADELKKFIQLNFKTSKDVSEKISVTKNNFTFVFQKWCDKVKDSIDVDWAKANSVGLLSADFFLADLLSDNNKSIKENLFVVLKNTKYELAKKIDENGFLTVSSVGFNDKQKAHKEFWAIYARPPKEEYWDYIINRRDLLVPQDIRERKGSFFTPQIWVEKSQEYLAKVLGETWQDDYYIWDCCAGTGNLENGLTNYDNVWVSTLDKQDIDVMVDRINNGWNMPENHIFQFDFLNDDFDKCPEELREILQDEEKRKKLVVYINPPYAEAGSMIGGKNGVSNQNKWHKEIDVRFGKFAKRELYALFLARIYLHIPNCIIGEFSKIKILQSSYFRDYRKAFLAKLSSMFLMPADTFDNVKGQFPIGFKIWDTSIKEAFSESLADVFDAHGNSLKKKLIFSYDECEYINDWLRPTWKDNSKQIGWLTCNGNDYSNQKYVAIVGKKSNETSTYFKPITKSNVLMSAIYLSCRHFTSANWLNDRDQFLYPNDNWKCDFEFQLNCLIYSLFHTQNAISSDHTVNHWIPFTREQVGCKKTFKSKFMQEYIADFLAGKISINGSEVNGKESPIELSPEAQAVYDAGLELWKYYHEQPRANPDASFYDIRKHFQGESKGRMNPDSDDEKYMELISILRKNMKILAKKIEPKVYEYGFLK